jgi:hypothetical protein
MFHSFIHIIHPLSPLRINNSVAASTVYLCLPCVCVPQFRFRNSALSCIPLEPSTSMHERRMRDTLYFSSVQRTPKVTNYLRLCEAVVLIIILIDKCCIPECS